MKEVQEFIRAEAPSAARGLSGEEALTANWERNQVWFKKLAARGWIAAAWNMPDPDARTARAPEDTAKE